MKTTKNKEKWKTIRGYSGRYEVSSYGRVKSLPRIKIRTSKCGNSYASNNAGMILKKILINSGYEQVTLHKEGDSERILVHRLVGESFIKNPQNKPQINHKDGNKKNNSLSNLEWVTASENGLHAYRELGRIPSQLGKFSYKHPRAKAVLQKTTRGSVVKLWKCGLDAVRDGGFESSCISRCCSGKSNVHKGFIWEYAS